MIGFPMSTKKIEEKLDSILSGVSDLKTDVSLLKQSHDQVKSDQGKMAETVNRNAAQLAEHQVGIEKLSSFSASHKKEIEMLKGKMSGFESTLIQRQPFWTALAKIWDKATWLVAGGVVAWLAGIIKLG